MPRSAGLMQASCRDRRGCDVKRSSGGGDASVRRLPIPPEILFAVDLLKERCHGTLELDDGGFGCCKPVQCALSVGF